MAEYYEKDELAAMEEVVKKILSGEIQKCSNPHCSLDNVATIWPFIEEESVVKKALLSLLIFIQESGGDIEFSFIDGEEDSLAGVIEQTRRAERECAVGRDPEPVMENIFKVLKALDALENVPKEAFFALAIIIFNIVMHHMQNKEEDILISRRCEPLRRSDYLYVPFRPSPPAVEGFPFSSN